MTLSSQLVVTLLLDQMMLRTEVLSLDTMIHKHVLDSLVGITQQKDLQFIMQQLTVVKHLVALGLALTQAQLNYLIQQMQRILLQVLSSLVVARVLVLIYTSVTTSSSLTMEALVEMSTSLARSM